MIVTWLKSHDSQNMWAREDGVITASTDAFCQPVGRSNCVDLLSARVMSSNAIVRWGQGMSHPHPQRPPLYLNRVTLHSHKWPPWWPSQIIHPLCPGCGYLDPLNCVLFCFKVGVDCRVLSWWVLPPVLWRVCWVAVSSPQSRAFCTALCISLHAPGYSFGV